MNINVHDKFCTACYKEQLVALVEARQVSTNHQLEKLIASSIDLHENDSVVQVIASAVSELLDTGPVLWIMMYDSYKKHLLGGGGGAGEPVFITSSAGTTASHHPAAKKKSMFTQQAEASQMNVAAEVTHNAAV